MIFIELRIDVYTSRENLTTKKKDFISKLKEKQCVQIHVSTTITTIRLFKKKKKTETVFIRHCPIVAVLLACYGILMMHMYT